MEPATWNLMLDDFAARKALPGCGAAAALTAGLGAALLQKVLRLAGPEEDEGDRVAATLEKLERLRERLAKAAESDGPGYERVLVALRMSGDDPADRRVQLDRALIAASEAPLHTARAAVELLDLVAPAVEFGKAVTETDALVAGDLALAAARGGLRVVEANLGRISDQGRVDSYRHEMIALRKRVGL